MWSQLERHIGFRELLQEAFSCAGLNWQNHVEIDSNYYRPAEVNLLIGDASKAKRKLDWVPKTRFVDLVRLMVHADLELAEKEAYLNNQDRFKVEFQGGVLPLY